MQELHFNANDVVNEILRLNEETQCKEKRKTDQPDNFNDNANLPFEFQD